jgi:hypothetical protein
MNQTSNIETLKFIEKELTHILRDENIVWHSLDISYLPPRVKRVWTQYNDNIRLFLHKISPATSKEAFYHPHPWLSAMKIVKGSYQMGLGCDDGTESPEILSTQIFNEGSYYDMTNPKSWHYVAASDIVYTIMITGPLFNPPVKMPKVPKETQSPLSKSEETEILDFFRSHYVN